MSKLSDEEIDEFERVAEITAEYPRKALFASNMVELSVSACRRIISELRAARAARAKIKAALEKIAMVNKPAGRSFPDDNHYWRMQEAYSRSAAAETLDDESVKAYLGDE